MLINLGYIGLFLVKNTEGQTVLFRESNGNVSVNSLKKSWNPILSRQSDGTILISG